MPKLTKSNYTKIAAGVRSIIALGKAQLPDDPEVRADYADAAANAMIAALEGTSDTFQPDTFRWLCLTEGPS